MNLLYLALVAVAFLALPAGFFIARAVPDELNIGRKWFVLLQRVLLIFVAALVFLSLRANPLFRLPYGSVLPYVLAICAAIVLLALHLVRYDWSVLPVFIALVLADRQLVLVQASLVFLHGLPTGTLVFAEPARRREFTLRLGLFWLLALCLTFLLPR